MQPARKPWWQQATALVSLGSGGAITGFAFAHGTPAHLASPTSVPVTLTALDQAAQPGIAQTASDESVVRSAIVKVASYYAKLAQTKTPSEMEALIWQQDSEDGADHGESCAAFASMTLQLGAQLAGKQSWVGGGSTYPWPLHDWVDARVDPNSDSLDVTSILQDAETNERWHPLGDGYQPQPGDWVLFDEHVEVVTGYSDGVLSTIGGDSLPNFSVNSHRYSGSLSSNGVEGFVDNGNLPAVTTAATSTGSASGSQQAGTSSSPSSAPASSSTGAKQTATATSQDDQQAAEALAAIPGTAAVQPTASVTGPGNGTGSGSATGTASTTGSGGATGSGRSAGSASADTSSSAGAAIPGVTASSASASSGGASSASPSPAARKSTSARSAASARKAKTAAKPPVTTLAAEPSAAIPGLPTTESSGATAASATPTSTSSASSGSAASSDSAASSAYQRHQSSASAATPGTAAQRAFINSIAPGAVAAQRSYGVPAAVTIAQAIDESAWGQSALASQDHNLFGIKGVGPAGSVALPTQEVYNGQTVNITANFRAYNDVAESIDDHGKLLADSGAYTAAMASKQSPNDFANALTGVYATDPDYGSSLISLMRQYNLYRYDASAAGSPSSSTTAASSGSGSAAASPKAQPHGATQSHPAGKAKTRTQPTAKATAPSLAQPATTPSFRTSSTTPASSSPSAGSTTAPVPTSAATGSASATVPQPAASADHTETPASSGASDPSPAGASGAGRTNATPSASTSSGSSPDGSSASQSSPTATEPDQTSDQGQASEQGQSGQAEIPGIPAAFTSGNSNASGTAGSGSGSSSTSGPAGTSASTAGANGASGSEGDNAAPTRGQTSTPAQGSNSAHVSSSAQASTSAAFSSSAPASAFTPDNASAQDSSSAPATDAELTAAYRPAPAAPAAKAPAAKKPVKRKTPGVKARRAAPRYVPEMPTPVKSALLSTTRKPLGRAEMLYRDVAAGVGLSWKILAACDWMQCDAHPRYSPVHGEKLGAVNPDGTVFHTKSEALAQSARDLVLLADAVYEIDLTLPVALTVLELANVFAAYRWGGLLRQNRTSAMEFPYSVQGLTDQFMHMRWPKIASPNAPDKPGSRYRRPFGAVPVVLSLDYPAIVL